jgi:hypothetical protein
MTRRIAVALLLPAVLSVSCGGGSDSTGGGLQQADVDHIANSLADALAASSGATGYGGSPTTALVVTGSRTTDLSSSAAVNHVMACPVDGHVTTMGNVYASCPTPPATGACNLSGTVTISYGDRTNNINDCTYDNGLVIDGSLFLSLAGTANGTAVTLTESLTGSLGLYRKGPSGGLVPLEMGGLSSCFVFLTAKLPERTITGDVCGVAVNRTF